MQVNNIYSNVRKYALIYAGGGVLALQALKLEIFSFPDNVHVYLGYFFSIQTVLCIFLGGGSVIDIIKNIKNETKPDEPNNKP